MASLEFFSDIILPVATDSTSNRNEHQVYFLGVKAENLTTILRRCHEIWNLNFLELSEPLQACNETVLTLPLLKDDVCMRFEASTILMLRIRVF